MTTLDEQARVLVARREAAVRHEYNHWLEGVREAGRSPTLAEYHRWSQFDDNLFWRLQCGDHLNLLDEAIARIASFFGGAHHV